MNQFGWDSLEGFRNELCLELVRPIGVNGPSHHEIKRLALKDISKRCEDRRIHYFEFGVFRGQTFRFAQELFCQESDFFGFDSFHGLPEAWHTSMPFHRQFSQPNYAPTLEQSHNNFDLHGVAPDSGRGKWVPGLFQDTLEPFLLQFDRKKRIVILIDCDLYSSCLYVLMRMHSILKLGDIILFDEFGDEQNEFKAFNDYVKSHYVKSHWKCIWWDQWDGLVVGFERC